MALTEIEYGSLASSEIMNNNFEYLDNKITDVSENLTTTVAAINSNIANVNSSVSSLGASLNASINSANSSISSLQSNVGELSGSYITTYINGTSWYREYFSDAEKTNRVWLEQGGQMGYTSWAYHTVSFVKEFSDTNYTWVTHADVQGVSKSTSSIGGTYAWGNGQPYNLVCWYACGK